MTQETSPTPPIPATPARQAPAAFWVLACCVAAGVAIAVAGRFATSASSYDAGLRNADPPFILSRSDEIGLAAWGAAVALLILASVMPRSAARHFARGALFTCLAAVPLTCTRRAYPDDRYNEAFCIWAVRAVPVDAVHNWAASRAPLKSSATVAPTEWPREIAGLSPDAVIELPNSRGVVLEWGQLGTWGTSRRIFVAKDESAAPPTDDEYIHFRWRLIAPGAYAAMQDQD